MDKTLEEQIGWRIHKLRESKRLTLADLAKRTGLSKALLSKIENGKVSSPVSTLLLISESLKVKLSYLIDNSSDQSETKYLFVRKSERLKLDRGTENFGFYFEMLAHQKPDKMMEPAVLIVENRRKHAVTYTHPGEELIYVIEGKMEFVYGKRKLLMEAGDSIYFDGDVPHGGRNMTDKTLKVLMVICNP
jgi:transcriptional regulator with XRE-family HTH domain